MKLSQIAKNYALWSEYVDPSGLDSEQSFNSKPIDEKILFILDCFGHDGYSLRWDTDSNPQDPGWVIVTEDNVWPVSPSDHDAPHDITLERRRHILADAIAYHNI